MDYILDEEFNDKKILMINKTKFEKIRYMEQSTTKGIFMNEFLKS